MSHWTDIKCTITDLEALKSTCEELGYEFLTNVEARGWGGATTPCEHIIRSKNCCYDIQVNKDGDRYSLKTDFWGDHVNKEFGKNGDVFGKVKELYNIHKAERMCRSRRMKTVRVTTNKSIKLEIYA